jgi:hypothetical protein
MMNPPTVIVTAYNAVCLILGALKRSLTVLMLLMVRSKGMRTIVSHIAVKMLKAYNQKKSSRDLGMDE